MNFFLHHGQSKRIPFTLLRKFLPLHGQSKCIPFTLLEIFHLSRAIETHSIYLVGIFSLIKGNRNAFHLPCSNFSPLHGQSNRIPFTLFELFDSSRAIEAYSIYPVSNFQPCQGQSKCIPLPFKLLFPFHRQSNHSKKPSRCLDSLL